MGRGTDTYNPYTPDSGARPPALTGRDAELARFASIISQLTAGVARLLQRKATSLSPIRDELMRNAVIYAPRRGHVDFTVPHCAAFVRRRYPT